MPEGQGYLHSSEISSPKEDDSYLSYPVAISPEVTVVGGQWPHDDAATTTLIGNSVLIDPGTERSLPYVVNNLQQARVNLDQIKYILLTHVDYDHASVCRKLMELLEQSGASTKLYVPKGATEVIQRCDNIQNAQYMYGRPFEAFPIFGELGDGGIIETGVGDITAIWTPGHVASHLCYGVGNTLIAGDVFGGYAEGRSDLPAMQESLLRTLEYPFDIVVEGHCDPRWPPMTRAAYQNIIRHIAVTNSDLKPGFAGMKSVRNE